MIILLLKLRILSEALHLCKAFQCCYSRETRSHLHPDQLPGEHSGNMLLSEYFCHNILKAHVCFYMCTNHMDMMTHTETFLWVFGTQGGYLRKCMMLPWMEIHSRYKTRS